MIYIDDYRSLNSLVSNTHHQELRLQLTAMLDRTITVFVDSSNASGCSFTGILIEVLPDSIKLITKLPQFSRSCIYNCRNGFNKSCPRFNQCSKLGTNTIIALDHITAFTYSTL